MHRISRLTLATLVALVAIAAAGTVVSCSKKAEDPKLTPKVAPPVIGKAGVLRAGIDLAYPPYGGKVGSEEVGLDVDVASALAERLGLTLQIVDVPADQAPAALSEGKVDIALGGLPLTEDLLTQVTFAGTYLTDGPAFFSSKEATITLTSLGKARPAVQQDSIAYWRIEKDLGSEIASAYPSLREALTALEAGHVESAAGDAVVAAYLARDFEGIRFSGQLGPATPIGIAVTKDATQLETAVREALDSLAADGVLDAIRSKWVGDLPQLKVDETQVG